MSLSDSGLHMNLLQNDHIGSLSVSVCVCVSPSGVRHFPSMPSSYGPDWSPAGRRSIFHPIHMREAVSSRTHMFPITCVFILPHDVLSRGSPSSSLRYWKSELRSAKANTISQNLSASLYELFGEHDRRRCVGSV